MNEQHQCDDFFIPSFLLTQLPLTNAGKQYTPIENFFRDTMRWMESLPLNECTE